MTEFQDIFKQDLSVGDIIAYASYNGIMRIYRIIKLLNETGNISCREIIENEDDGFWRENFDSGPICIRYPQMAMRISEDSFPFKLT